MLRETKGPEFNEIEINRNHLHTSCVMLLLYCLVFTTQLEPKPYYFVHIFQKKLNEIYPVFPLALWVDYYFAFWITSVHISTSSLFLDINGLMVSGNNSISFRYFFSNGCSLNSNCFFFSSPFSYLDSATLLTWSQDRFISMLN